MSVYEHRQRVKLFQEQWSKRPAGMLAQALTIMATAPRHYDRAQRAAILLTASERLANYQKESEHDGNGD